MRLREIIEAQRVHHLAWVLMVNDGSVEHLLEVKSVVSKGGSHVSLEEIESRDEVIVGLVRVPDSVVTGCEDVVGLLLDQSLLIVEGCVYFKDVLIVDLL